MKRGPNFIDHYKKSEQGSSGFCYVPCEGDVFGNALLIGTLNLTPGRIQNHVLLVTSH